MQRRRPALGRAGCAVYVLAAAVGLLACRPREAVPTAERDAGPFPSASRAASARAPLPPHGCVARRDLPASPAHHASVTELTVDLARCRVTPVVGGRLSTLDALAPKGAVAGINGGYFDENGHALGLRRVAGTDRVPGWAKPAGGVVAFEGNRLFVGPRAQMPNSAESAVQCKPLLVENGGERGIRRDDGHRAARTTVCDTGDGALHIVLFVAAPDDGPTLYETAEILRAPRDRGGFGCRAALNLDGGPSTGLWVAEGGSILPRGPIVDALFVVPLPSTLP